MTLTRNSDSCVLNKANATKNAKIEIKVFEWYVTQYTPSREQQEIRSEQFLSRIPTELQNSSIIMRKITFLYGLL